MSPELPQNHCQDSDLAMSRFVLLKELPNRASSEERRDLLREVTIS